MSSLDKITNRLMHGTFFVLMALSVFLYKERLFADAAYYFFKIVNEGWFHVEHGRIVLGVSQILPLLGYFLGLPLKVLMVLSSLGHELFYYTLFLFLAHVLKNKYAAVTLFAIHLIGQLWLYYSPMYEICYGAAFTVLFYALMRSRKLEDDKWLILFIVVEWFAISSHLENCVLVLFVILYDGLDRSWNKKIHSLSLVVFLIGLLLEFLTLTAYEKQNIEKPFHEDATFLNLLEPSYLADLWTLFSSYFVELILIAVVAIPIMLWRRRWYKLLLFIGAMGVLIVAINNKANATEFIRYFESMYNPLVFLGVFILVFELVRNIASNQWQSVLLMVVVFVGMYRVYWIVDYGFPLRQRMAQLERIVDAAQLKEGSKFLIAKENFEQAYSDPNWATPIETFLLSAIDGKEASLTIATIDDMEYDQSNASIQTEEYLFRRAEIEKISTLNSKYFQLNNEAYRFLNTTKGATELDNIKGQISFDVEKKNGLLRFNSSDTCLLLIRLELAEGYTLPSHKSENVFISYHWFQGEKLIEWDGIRSPLEIDISSNFSQHIKLAVPSEKGNYQLQLDLVQEGKRWFESTKRFEVTVN